LEAAKKVLWGAVEMRETFSQLSSFSKDTSTRETAAKGYEAAVRQVENAEIAVQALQEVFDAAYNVWVPLHNAGLIAYTPESNVG
jgi:hypothetical protein